MRGTMDSHDALRLYAIGATIVALALALLNFRRSPRKNGK